MTYTGAIFFMGEYRPAYFEADSVAKLNATMQTAIHKADDAQWFITRISEAAMNLKNNNCSAFACEHGARGVSMVKRQHDPFLDRVTANFPAYPGLDYSDAVNA